MQDCYKNCKGSIILCKQATHDKEGTPLLNYECTHSSGCHERFATLAEFQEHWKTKHQSPCVKKQCQFCGEVSEEINDILACGGYALNANQQTEKVKTK
jgi:hypothetical protein